MQTMQAADITLADADGATVRFGDLSANPLVVVLVRYFGSLACQAFVSDVSQAVSRRKFVPSAKVVAVGGSADYQARSLRYDQGILMPLLLDADQQVRELAQVGDLGPGVVHPLGMARSASAMWRGHRPQKPTRDTLRAPGVAIFGPDLSVQWVHEGAFAGDYPTVDELIERAANTVR